MTDLANAFGFRRGAGPHFSDPWMLGPGHAVPVANLVGYEASGPTSRASTTSNFFTLVGYHGTALNSDFTADTYKTLLNVTAGRGLVAAFIGPTGGGAETTTFEVTIDGNAAVEIPVTVASAQRAFLGVFGKNNSGTVSELVLADEDQMNAGKTTFSTSAGGVLMPWKIMKQRGLSCLQFNVSLLVRVKHSANVTGTSSQERQCGIIHMNGLY